MEERIQKLIIDYFSFFEEVLNTSKSSLKECQKCAIAINKLLKRYKNIRAAEIQGTPLENFEDIQSKLCATIHNLISEEIQEIRRHLSKLEDLFEKLCNKYKNFTENCRDVDFSNQTPLIKGTPLQPSLSQLRLFAEDTITFASQICAQIDTSLTAISLRGVNAEGFTENFQISPHWQRKTSEIVAYTSFCSENQIQ